MPGIPLSRRPAHGTAHQQAWFRQHAVTMIALAVGLALRMYTLPARDLWTDEAARIATAKVPVEVRSLVTLGYEHARETYRLSPPLYSLLLRLFIQFFGDSLLSYRLLSLMAGVGMIWLTYRIGASAHHPFTGQLAAVLVAISPYFVSHAQDANTYSVAGFLSTLAIWRFWQALQQQTARAWIIWGIAAVLAAFAHHYAWLVVLFQGIYVVTVYFRRHRQMPRGWHIGLGTVVLLYMPYLPIAALQFRTAQGLGYVGREPQSYVSTLATNLLNVSTGYRASQFRDVLSLQLAPEAVARLGLLITAIAIPLIIAGLGVRSALNRGDTGPGCYLLVVLGGAMLLGPAGLFVARHLTIVAALYFVMMALGLAAVSIRARTGLLALLMLVNVVSLGSFYSNTWSRTRPQDWRGAAREVARRVQPGDLVVVNTWVGGAFAFSYQLWSVAPPMVLLAEATPPGRLPGPIPPSWAGMDGRTRFGKIAYVWRVSEQRQLIEITDPALLPPDEEVRMLHRSLCTGCLLWILHDDHQSADGWPAQLKGLKALMEPIHSERYGPDLSLLVLQVRPS